MQHEIKKLRMMIFFSTVYQKEFLTEGLNKLMLYQM